jgi:hypothetical protein
MCRAVAAASALLLVLGLVLVGIEDVEFLMSLAVLSGVLVVVATGSRRIARESFADEDEDEDGGEAAVVDEGAPPSAAQSNNTASFVTKLVAIPSQIKETIAPSLDKLINSASEEAIGGGEAMLQADYMEDRELQRRGGVLDEKKFAQLQEDFRRIDKLLVSMKDYNRKTYDAIVERSSS